MEWSHIQTLTDDAPETRLYGAPATPWATRPLPDCAYLHTERRKPDEMQKLGYTFRSTGDTEVLLCAYAVCGEECLDRLNGMWAFLKYDADKRIVFGSRYRFGVKPLYRYQDGERVLFALEIKTIVSSGYYSGATNWGVASSFLIQGRLENTDETFYQDIVKVPAASAFEKRLSGKVGPGLLSKICEVDPLICPKCKSAMRVISSIEDPSVIQDLLAHLATMAGKSKIAAKSSRPANPPNMPLSISSFKHTLTLSTATPNTHGMNTSSHNALWNRGVQERSV